MKIFFAGATGVLGRRVMPQLIKAGHDITAIGRSEAARNQLASAGARPIELDLFEAAVVSRAVAGHDVRFLGSLGETLARSQRISNRKLKAESGWAPRYPSMRAGWKAVLGSIKGSNQIKMVNYFISSKHQERSYDR